MSKIQGLYVLGIYAMGLAAELAMRDIQNTSRHLLELREYFLGKLDKIAPAAIVNGPLENRLPNNLSIGLPVRAFASGAGRSRPVRMREE
jgi:cysteine sulfinate desulfinase/cysteine desulfurase-like protein